jgi:hypothetical protein
MLSVFSFSKCRLFHNATFFGSCIIHILNTGVLKFKRKFRRLKVNDPIKRLLIGISVLVGKRLMEYYVVCIVADDFKEHSKGVCLRFSPFECSCLHT